MSEENRHFVAVIGAGPAGLFGARELAVQGAQVVLFNRDIKPGGLAEYGIYPDKHTMKGGLRKQFHQVLDNGNITYYGNVKIGAQGDLSLEDLRCLGFQAMLVTAGAAGNEMARPARRRSQGRIPRQRCSLLLQQAAAIQPEEVLFRQTGCHYRCRQRDGGHHTLPDPRAEGG